VLSIGKLGSSAGQLEYYERQVAAGAEEYYAGRGEVPGSWVGAGLEALDLTPGVRVTRDGFMALMHGAHPVDGSVLPRSHSPGLGHPPDRVCRGLGVAIAASGADQRACKRYSFAQTR
jgi:hypothetical protein